LFQLLELAAVLLEQLFLNMNYLPVLTCKLHVYFNVHFRIGLRITKHMLAV